MNQKITLGAKALNNAMMFQWAPEFVFVFRNKAGNLITNIKSNSIQACLISSKVYKTFLADPTISEMTFIADNITKNEIENYFQNIFNGLDNRAKTIHSYLSVAELIGTEDVVDEIMKIMKTQAPMDSNNCIEKIILKIHANINYDEEIMYAAQHLTELIQDDAFDDCPEENKMNILTSILSVCQQKELDESCIEIIFDFIDTFDDDDFIKLVSLLNPKFMTPDLIGRSLRRITTENITEDYITFLFNRFVSPAKKLAETTINCPHTRGSLNGIFAKLKERGNPVDNDEVRISTPGEIIRKTELKNIIDADNKLGVFIKAKSSEYTKIIFDFCDNKKVRLTGYEIKVRGEQNKYNFPKSWEILGSDDKYNFTIIDRRVGYDDFSAGKVKYFSISDNKKGYRYIEFHLNSNHGNQNEQKFLRLAAIEFYGDIVIH